MGCRILKGLSQAPPQSQKGTWLAEGLKEPQKLSILELERILRGHFSLYISPMKAGVKGLNYPGIFITNI